MTDAYTMSKNSVQTSNIRLLQATIAVRPKLEQLKQDKKLAANLSICSHTRFLTSTAFKKASFNGSKELLVHSDRALLIPQDPFL